MLYNDDICIVDEIRVDNTTVLTALNTDVTSIDGDQVSVDEITPIPITAEILEKNGFEKTLDVDDMECYRYYNRAADGHIKIILHDGGDGDWSIEIVNYDKFHDHEIRYKNEFLFLKVHQLQHALRLCEIEKEIEI